MKTSAAKIEICILAGGLSSRMGENKAAMVLGRSTLLSTIKSTAQNTGLPVRVIRSDIVERCGPLGGVYTALKSTRGETVLFLACDMPFLKSEFLAKVLQKFDSQRTGLFAFNKDRAGFPFVLSRAALATVELQLNQKKFSLNSLADALEAQMIRPSAKDREQLFNINTPEEWKKAQRQVRESGKKPLGVTCKTAPLR